jgi:hypothetical protein
MGALVIFDGAGPLPVSAKFNSPLDGPVTFVLTGTAWTQTAGSLIGLDLVLDGNGIGNSAMCYANNSADHMAMRTTFIEVDNLSYGPHTIEIIGAYSDTVTDFNDYFQVTMLF